MRAKLIVNPDARWAPGGARLRRIESALREEGLDVTTFIASRAGDARCFAQSARRESYQMVIGAGGDGTISEVVNGMAGSGLVLGVLPMGTGNVLAWELDIPRDPLRACALLAEGRARTMDLGVTSDGRYFSCMAGVGLDAQIVRELDPAMKELLGVMAYPLSGLRTVMNYSLPELRITLDGRTPPLHGYALVVCNSRHYGGRFVLCPEAVIDDGWLDVCVLQEGYSSAIIRSGISVLFNTDRRAHGLKFYRARSAYIEASRKVLVQSDGDIVGTTPIGFSVVPRALKVMVSC